MKVLELFFPIIRFIRLDEAERVEFFTGSLSTKHLIPDLTLGMILPLVAAAIIAIVRIKTLDGDKNWPELRENPYSDAAKKVIAEYGKKCSVSAWLMIACLALTLNCCLTAIPWAFIYPVNIYNILVSVFAGSSFTAMVHCTLTCHEDIFTAHACKGAVDIIDKHTHNQYDTHNSE